MASGLISSIQSLSTNLLKAIRGTTSTSHQQQDSSYPVTDQHKSVREDLEKLSRILARIQAIQEDAEEREIHDRSVRLWLSELRGVGYQAEDVLDEFYYEVPRSIVERGDAAIEAYHRDQGTKRKFDEMYASFSLASYSFTAKVSIPDGMAEKIKSITERFEEISNARRDLHFREEDGIRLVIYPQIRPPTSSHVDERAIFGREEEKDIIITMLNPSSRQDFMVLPIVGMGGIGKTTLAQLVYNDSRIHGLFNKRCWISVSEDFDPVRLTKVIVDSLSEKPCESSELSKLQDVLKENIRGIALFLVLDDVWNEKRNLWESFRVGFLGAKFVRILTTTRNTSVAKIMQTTSFFQLGSLPKESGWSLFKHFAFGTREASENANLHNIGYGIVEKCKCSPLAIKALGSILCYETDEEKWKEILESDISEIDETGEIMPALRLSYQKLPRHLKPCFLYLSMFPKDTPFERDMVVRLWMAQGYINGNTRNLKTLEEIGSEYFDELQGRSLVERAFTDGILPYKNRSLDNFYHLHDLIHDLARSISQEAYRAGLENDQQSKGPCKVYHLYVTKHDKFLGSFLAPSNCGSIRTVVSKTLTENLDFAIFPEIAGARALHLRSSLLPNTVGTMKHLRYLFFEHNQMETLPETLCLLYNLQTLDLKALYLWKLPENIKHLINLRYFRLRSDKIQHLPESIFLLRNLHALLLKYCTKLQEVPRGIEKLTRLCILDLPESLIYMPPGIGKLTTLKPLSGHFSVMDHGMIGELKDMNKLSGLLCISGLRNISDVEYSRNINLASKPNLHKLTLNFQEDRRTLNCGDKLHLHLTINSSKNTKNENDENMQDAILQSLQPHGNLIELAILNYEGQILPSWLLNSLLPKLRTLTLNFCIEPNFLPPFGQLPYLRFLKISGSTGVRNVRDKLGKYSLLAEYGSSKQPKEPSYPSLEVLSFRYMFNLVEWQAHDGDFPCLKELIIEDCPKLRKIATIPQQVREITFKYCPKLKLLTCPLVMKKLKIHNCGFREISFRSISENLRISNCVELTSINWSDEGLISVQEVTFERCPKLELLNIPVETLKLKIHECGFREISFRSVSENLTISNCIELTSINWSDGGLNFVKEVAFEHCPNLELLTIPVGTLKLEIHKCGFREISFRSVFENLKISNCVKLTSINWSDGGLNSIKEVLFESCPKLEFLIIPVGTLKLKIHECGIREISLHSLFENLTIFNCVELSSINWSDGDLNFVGEISFEYCPKLKLPTIPTGIKKLKIAYCSIKKLVFPLQSSIQIIDVSHCSVLTSIHWIKRETSPHTNLLFEDCTKVQNRLKNVQISHCPMLQFPVKDVLHSMTGRAEIYDCPTMGLGHRYVYQSDTMTKELKLFGNIEIHLSPNYSPIPLLDERTVSRMTDFNLFWNNETHLSSSLYDNTIPLLGNPFTLCFRKKYLQEEESLTCEPWDGVSCQHIMLNLASLVRLEILRCRKVISVTGLDNLRNLKLLSISYCRELCNWNDKTLPLSLEFLKLDSCEKLSSLPLLSVPYHSNSLNVLVIRKCPRLAVLKGFHGLMNLKTVELLHCMNISISLSTESFQFRSRINIGDCPLMRDWCQRNNITYNELIDNPKKMREKLNCKCKALNHKLLTELLSQAELLPVAISSKPFECSPGSCDYQLPKAGCVGSFSWPDESENCGTYDNLGT